MQIFSRQVKTQIGASFYMVAKNKTVQNNLTTSFIKQMNYIILRLSSH